MADESLIADILQDESCVAGEGDLVHGYAVYRHQFCTRTRSPEPENSDAFFSGEPREDRDKVGDTEHAPLIEEEIVKLSLLSSNLQAEKETGLRSLLTLKVQYGTIPEGHGNILTQNQGQLFSTPCMIYYNLLKCKTFSGESVTSDGDEKLFVVCFLVMTETGLDLYHADLDDYSKSLAPYLDKYMESVDVSEYLNLIESWYDINICFVSRCLARLQDIVAPLLYHTLLGDKICLVSIPDTERSDIERFIACCTLSQLVEDNSDDTQVIYSSSPNPSFQGTFSLTFDGMSYGSSSDKTTPFCTDCLASLRKVKSDDPFKLRQILENYKLKVIQDMNTLKRLTKLAETDYYALYRAYAFLVSCDNGDILLQNAKIQNEIEDNAHTKSVLQVLEDYIEDKGGFKLLGASEDEKSKIQYMIKILGH